MSYDAELPLIQAVLAPDVAAMARPRVVVRSLTLARDVVIAGDGVTLLPDYLCRGALESGAPMRPDPAARRVTNDLFLTLRKASLRTARVGFARDLIVNEIGRALGARGRLR